MPHKGVIIASYKPRQRGEPSGRLEEERECGRETRRHRLFLRGTRGCLPKTEGKILCNTCPNQKCEKGKGCRGSLTLSIHAIGYEQHWEGKW